MAWCRPGDNPLSEPMMNSLLARPQWVKTYPGPKVANVCVALLVVNASAVISFRDRYLVTSADTVCWNVRIQNKGRLFVSRCRPSVWRNYICTSSGVGVSKQIFFVSLFSEFFNNVKRHVKYGISRLYFTCAVAAQLRWCLPNINVIRIIQEVLLQDQILLAEELMGNPYQESTARCIAYGTKSDILHQIHKCCLHTCQILKWF